MKLSTCAAVTMAALAAIPGRVDAGIDIDISDIGSDVVASTSGSADLTDLTAIDTALLFAPGEVTPSKGSGTGGKPGPDAFFQGRRWSRIIRDRRQDGSVGRQRRLRRRFCGQPLCGFSGDPAPAKVRLRISP